MEICKHQRLHSDLMLPLHLFMLHMVFEFVVLLSPRERERGGVQEKHQNGMFSRELYLTSEQ